RQWHLSAVRVLRPDAMKRFFIVALVAACTPAANGNDGGPGGGSGAGGGNSAGGGSGGDYPIPDVFCADAPAKLCEFEVRCGQAATQSECVAWAARVGFFDGCAAT